MQCSEGWLTTGEREELTCVEDRLIALFCAHQNAVDAEDRAQSRLLQAEIDSLLARREEIRKWAARGSA